MTAGRGVIHNENPLPGTTTHALQLWVNLPASEKMAASRSRFGRADLPGDGSRCRDWSLSGRSGGVSSPTLNHVPVAAIDARMDDGATFEHELEAGANAFLLVLEGSAIVGRQERPVASGELAWLTRSDEATSLVTIKASGGATHLLLFAGRPLREPVVFGGPFVMNTQEQIDEAFADFRAGRFSTHNGPRLELVMSYVIIGETVSNLGGHATRRKRTTGPPFGDGVITFEGTSFAAHRTLSIKCAPCGVQRICRWAFIRRCSSHCTVLSVTAVEIGSSHSCRRSIMDDDIGLAADICLVHQQAANFRRDRSRRRGCLSHPLERHDGFADELEAAAQAAVRPVG